eukprot:CAMPEP_0115883796 /NCGR_PEP_ID=MMETSP0287-20121206/29766_1 /TAXON_ID=412157 /ORGANISM="Chrysochromulina rotalis, Strain UIO044" /LENGTH=100 /DNA_ID=CAMNT_0003340039 /DNA_START=166 /DNA_END=465 /DNA_ORIENTATION=+
MRIAAGAAAASLGIKGARGGRQHCCDGTPAAWRAGSHLGESPVDANETRGARTGAPWALVAGELCSGTVRRRTSFGELGREDGRELSPGDAPVVEVPRAC